jgi:hypothetical protein
LLIIRKLLITNRTEFLNAMGGYGIPKKLVEMTMKDNDAKITISGNGSKSFNVLQGETGR